MYVRKHRKPNRKSTFFDPMIYALDRIKAYVDSTAFLTHNDDGQRVIKYRQINGKRLVLGNKHTARLVYDNANHEFTEAQAIQLANELGQV